MHLFNGWSMETPAMAASSSLQPRAMSNLGTWSATATTNCELKTIIENEIGMVGLLLGRHRIAKMHTGRALISFESLWVSSMQKQTNEHRGPNWVVLAADKCRRMIVFA